jgi:hypothetical protein
MEQDFKTTEEYLEYLNFMSSFNETLEQTVNIEAQVRYFE